MGSAIIVSCEDDAGDTIKPRLMAAGADVGRVHLLDWVLREGNGAAGRQHFNAGRDAEALAALARRVGDVRLIIIDPITAYLGAADSHKTADVRAALAPMQTMAAATGAAVIIVSHLNKGGENTTAKNRVSGSGAFVAVCRSGWLVATDPQDADGKRRVLTPLKNNIGDDKTGFTFTVQPALVGDGIASSRIEFGPESVTVTPEDLQSAAAGSAAAELDDESLRAVVGGLCEAVGFAVPHLDHEFQG